MPCYIVDTIYGRAVVEDSSLRRAKARALREYGTRNYKDCRKATMQDLVEVKNFGGWLPISVRPDVEVAAKSRNGR